MRVCAGAGPCLARPFVLWLWLEAHAPLALVAYVGPAVLEPRGHLSLWRQLACGSILNLLDIS